MSGAVLLLGIVSHFKLNILNWLHSSKQMKDIYHNRRVPQWGSPNPLWIPFFACESGVVYGWSLERQLFWIHIDRTELLRHSGKASGHFLFITYVLCARAGVWSHIALGGGRNSALYLPLRPAKAACTVTWGKCFPKPHEHALKVLAYEWSKTIYNVIRDRSQSPSEGA